MRVAGWVTPTDEERTTGKKTPRVIRITFTDHMEIFVLQQRLDALVKETFKRQGGRVEFSMIDIDLEGRDHRLEVVWKE